MDDIFLFRNKQTIYGSRCHERVSDPASVVLQAGHVEDFNLERNVCANITWTPSFCLKYAIIFLLLFSS